MGKTVRQLLAEIDSEELTEWIAFERLEPFGSLMDDFRAGQICATVANYAGKVRKEDAAAAQPGDFMPTLRQTADRKSDTQRPVLLADPEAHARLIKATLFGLIEEN
jgi:hypothetical protein